MQTLILNHYPPVIKQIKEMQQIAKAEDIEFSKLNVSINEIIQNMFVFTADETGIIRFEKLLGIKPKAAQSLDDRRAAVLFRINQRKMSLTELKNMLSGYLQDIEFFPDANNLELKITIGIDTLGEIRLAWDMVDEILPLNIYIISGYHTGFKVPNYYGNSVRMGVKFYPRFNLPPLYLNSRWLLDGRKKLTGYDGGDPVDLYPSLIELKVSFRVAADTTARFYAGYGAHTEPGTRTSGIRFWLGEFHPFGDMNTLLPDRYPVKIRCIRTLAALNAYTGTVTIKNMNFLSTGWKLNGARKLNGFTENR